MSFHLNKTMEAYINLISIYSDNVELNKDITKYEQLDILSDIANCLITCKKYIPLDFLMFDNIKITTIEDIENKIPTTDSTTNMEILLARTDRKHLFDNIIQNIGKHIYYSILGFEDNELNKQLGELSVDLAEIFLNRNSEELDKYASIRSNDGSTLLHHLGSARELFARAFKSFVVTRENITSSRFFEFDFKDNETELYSEKLSNLLLGCNRIASNTTLNISNELSEEDINNILLNEERIAFKDKFTDNNSVEKSMLYELLSDKDKNIIEVYNNNEDYYMDVENENILDYKQLIELLDSKSLCELEDFLDEDIQKLNEEIAVLESESNFLKSEITAGRKKRKDTALDEMLRFLFFLSQEHRTKVRIRKSLDSADITYTREHIEFSENRDKEKRANKIINDEVDKADENKESKAQAKINVKDVKETIYKIFGLELNDIQNTILNSSKGYNKTIKLSSKEKKKKKAKIKEQENTVEKNKEPLKIIKGDLAMNSIIKEKLNSVYTNSSSKFRNKEYSKLKVNKEVKSANLGTSEMNRLLDDLLKEAEFVAKEKETKKKDLELENSFNL